MFFILFETTYKKGISQNLRFYDIPLTKLTIKLSYSSTTPPSTTKLSGSAASPYTGARVSS